MFNHNCFLSFLLIHFHIALCRLLLSFNYFTQPNQLSTQIVKIKFKKIPEVWFISSRARNNLKGIIFVSKIKIPRTTVGKINDINHLFIRLSFNFLLSWFSFAFSKRMLLFSFFFLFWQLNSAFYDSSASSRLRARRSTQCICFFVLSFCHCPLLKLGLFEKLFIC